jgi:hypothetical protein
MGGPRNGKQWSQAVGICTIHIRTMLNEQRNSIGCAFHSREMNIRKARPPKAPRGISAMLEQNLDH